MPSSAAQVSYLTQGTLGIDWIDTFAKCDGFISLFFLLLKFMLVQNIILPLHLDGEP